MTCILAGRGLGLDMRHYQMVITYVAVIFAALWFKEGELAQWESVQTPWLVE
jgi:hypothetical protein